MEQLTLCSLIYEYSVENENTYYILYSFKKKLYFFHNTSRSKFYLCYKNYLI